MDVAVIAALNEGGLEAELPDPTLGHSTGWGVEMETWVRVPWPGVLSLKCGHLASMP